MNKYTRKTDIDGLFCDINGRVWRKKDKTFVYINAYTKSNQPYISVNINDKQENRHLPTMIWRAFYNAAPKYNHVIRTKDGSFNCALSNLVEIKRFKSSREQVKKVKLKTDSQPKSMPAG